MRPDCGDAAPLPHQARPRGEQRRPVYRGADAAVRHGGHTRLTLYHTSHSPTGALLRSQLGGLTAPRSAGTLTGGHTSAVIEPQWWALVLRSYGQIEESSMIDKRTEWPQHQREDRRNP